MRRTLALAAALILAGVAAADLSAVKQAEARRVEVIAKVRPAVVAVFSQNMDGGGSGVIIDPAGFALTNFHVVDEGKAFKCGLADGVLYDAVVVGLDKVGDVSLIKLLPKEKVKDKDGKEVDKPFPFVPLGDSDKIQPGDWSLAMGNPFLLATDFTPTVTYGLVSGTHRYQYPAGTLLEYTDCIQIDTSINPGNSGGPLFNTDGELIGINGRGSFDKRGRVNSGVGYAISINQIKNFLGHLYAGIDTDHATLGAAVKTASDDEGLIPHVVVNTILDEADAARRGLLPDDELVEFAGRPVDSVNQYKNVLGIYPKGWRLPLTYRRDNKKHEILVRLMGVLPKEMQEGGGRRPRQRPRPGEPQPRPGQPQPPPPGERPEAPKADSPALKLYKAKAGFANFYFNELAQKKLLDGFGKHGDFAPLTGAWRLEGELKKKDGPATPVKLEITDQPGEEGKGTKTVVKLNLGGLDYSLDPLKSNQDVRDIKDPPGSGGLLMAVYHYHRLLTQGAKGFEGGFSHGGAEPFYPPRADGSAPARLGDLRTDTEVLHTEHAAVHGKWYFAKGDQNLLGFEVTITKDDDPCELYLGDYRPVDGRQLPHRIAIVYGNDAYGVLTVKDYKLAAK
ncbi:MAG TPA: trypsin-like peptidase domain-containing protein [Gemmataceae bacterium]|jgi:S1-C subfamily serine protease